MSLTLWRNTEEDLKRVRVVETQVGGLLVDFDTQPHITCTLEGCMDDAQREYITTKLNWLVSFDMYSNKTTIRIPHASYSDGVVLFNIGIGIAVCVSMWYAVQSVFVWTIL